MISWREQLQHQPTLRDMSTWPPIDLSEFSDMEVAKFNFRKMLVAAVLDGASVRSAAKAKGVSASNLSRLLNRCLGSAEGESPALSSGLFPHGRLQQNRRRKALPAGPNGAGYAGAFRALIDRNPVFEKFLYKLIRKDLANNRLTERFAPLGFRKAALSYLDDHGWTDNDYPLNTKTRAREPFRRLYHSIRLELLARSRAGHNEEVLQQQLRGLRPYEHVELDEHKMDCTTRGTIYYQEPWGKRVRLARLWLIVVVDRCSHAVLGYAFGYWPEPTQDDALLCLNDLLIKRNLKEIHELPFGYAEGAGFPSGVIPECEWATPGIISWDNHWSHSGTRLLGFAHETLRATTNPGIPALPIARKLVESIFKIIAQVVQRLPSTTGSHPKDDRRESPRNYRKPPAIRVEALEELVEVVIANYNAQIKMSLQGRSPLEVIRDHIENGYRPTLLMPSDRSFRQPFEVDFIRTVRGDLTKSYRPRVNIDNFQYGGNCLHSAAIIGRKILVRVHADARYATAWTLKGDRLGALIVQGPWKEFPHSLRSRNRIANATKELPLHELTQDACTRYLLHLGETSEKPRHALEAYRIEREIQDDPDRPKDGQDAGDDPQGADQSFEGQKVKPQSKKSSIKEQEEWRPKHR